MDQFIVFITEHCSVFINGEYAMEQDRGHEQHLFQAAGGVPSLFPGRSVPGRGHCPGRPQRHPLQ